MLKLTIIAALCLGVRSQYSSSSSPSSSSSSYGSSPSSSSYSSPSSSSYSSPSSSSSSMSASPASSVSYPSVNMPLLSIPVTVGNASYGSTNSSTSSTSSTSGSSTNFLATLGSAVTNLSPPSYSYGVYQNDFDASRDSYYNHDTFYPLNIYVNPISGMGGPLNLSNPVAVSAAQWWAPYPYRLAQWNDGYTTQGSVIANTTAAAVTTTTVATMGSSGNVGVVNASLYYAAYGGSLTGLGVPGLGLQVPGPAPANVLTPGFNVAYNVGTSPASSSSSSTGNTGTSSMGSSYGSSSPSSSSYSSSPSSSYSSSPSSSSSYSGRRRRAVDFASVMQARQALYR